VVSRHVLGDLQQENKWSVAKTDPFDCDDFMESAFEAFEDADGAKLPPQVSAGANDAELPLHDVATLCAEVDYYTDACEMRINAMDDCFVCFTGDFPGFAAAYMKEPKRTLAAAAPRRVSAEQSQAQTLCDHVARIAARCDDTADIGKSEWNLLGECDPIRGEVDGISAKLAECCDLTSVAEELGFSSVLAKIEARSDIRERGFPRHVLLDAFRDSDGLLHPAKRALLSR